MPCMEKIKSTININYAWIWFGTLYCKEKLNETYHNNHAIHVWKLNESVHARIQAFYWIHALSTEIKFLLCKKCKKLQSFCLLTEVRLISLSKSAYVNVTMLMQDVSKFQYGYKILLLFPSPLLSSITFLKAS